MPAPSGSRFTSDFKSSGNRAKIISAYRVAIHLRTIKWRQIGISDDVFSEDSKWTISQPDDLGS
jgi:hypothetical protein